MDYKNHPMYLLFRQIMKHVNYHHNQRIDEQEGNGTVRPFFSSEVNKTRRVYIGSFDHKEPFDTCVMLTIKEDGGTRTVFSGRIYTLEQYLMIDQLAR